MSFGLETGKKIDLLCNLGGYMEYNGLPWQNAKERAAQANQWFLPAHIELAVFNIIRQFLKRDKLEAWLSHYTLPKAPKTVGIVMAGNIPLVGFHDFLCGFISGHNILMKLSSKDEILLTHLLSTLIKWEPAVAEQIKIAERLKNCDAYIATGSNNTARYFEQYFAKYPHIIRRNRTSVAVLDGTETDEELALLADDVYLYYGLGCRNVTQVCVPRGYDFTKLLRMFRKNDSYINLHKYKNNYDYHLAIYLLNNVPYMSNESLLMVENEMPFSAVSVLHYKYFDDKAALIAQLQMSQDIQAIIGKGFVPFGESQKPALIEYADGIDTMKFLCGL